MAIHGNIHDLVFTYASRLCDVLDGCDLPVLAVELDDSHLSMVIVVHVVIFG